ncbi:Platinum sensitivity protein [Coemansia javaensis]|uniref:Platinum sensitivity protein n=1 Tax=Coemansia javaensis TaxID=2761396 RepID=A0A9W8H7L0_9FUNG|nr:Platinum sensitivity protein [Coemansia javaensis]
MASADSQVRVKVYRLDEGTTWIDKGTGFCTLEDYQGVLHLNVVSECELNRLILDCVVQKGEVYQQQESTLIVWTEPTGEDLALSFQEQEGCLSILNQIAEFESAVKGKFKSALEPCASPLDDVALPWPSMETLAEIEHIIGEASMSLFRRDKLASTVVKSGYIGRLQELHETCEDLEATKELHTICSIMRRIVLLNDSSVLEHITRDENIIGVVGMLEYDPRNPVEPGTYRDFLRDRSRYKEVVPIRDAEVQAKIRQTFRLQYLKDVVLAQVADEGALPAVSALMFFNHAQIANYVHHNEAFVDELFGIIRQPGDAERKHDAVLFLRQFCAMSRSLPIAYRIGLYRTLSQHGLLLAVEYALRTQSPALNSAGYEILMAVLDQDRALVRAHVLEQGGQQPHSGPSLLRLVVEGSQADAAESQTACREAVRMLLDTLGPPIDAMDMAAGPPASSGSSSSMIEQDTGEFLALFYDAHARDLMAPLARLTPTEAASMGANSGQAVAALFLCELLSSMVRLHGHHARDFVVSSGVMQGVGLLLAAKPTHLRLAALRAIRACVGQQDDALARHLITHGVVGLAIGLLLETLPRDNLVSAACRELLAAIAERGPMPLLAHVLGAHAKALRQVPDTLEFLQQAYDGRLQRADRERSGGLATPTVGASRKGALSINMLVGHDNKPLVANGSGSGGGGGALDGPWGSAVTDEIEDAYLESLDDDEDDSGDNDSDDDLGGYQGAPMAADSAANGSGDGWLRELPRESPEPDAPQSHLGPCVDSGGRSPPAAGAATGSSTPPPDRPPPPPLPLPPLKRRGSSLDVQSSGDSDGAKSGPISVADAFPESRPIARKLAKRPLGGSRAGSAGAQIRISVSLPARPPQSWSEDGDGDGKALSPSLTKTPRSLAVCQAEQGPNGRNGSGACSRSQGSDSTVASSPAMCRSPPKKARTASS